jgi:ribulose-phosphate 3-epimerase
MPDDSPHLDVVPAILAKSVSEFERRVAQVRPYVHKIQLDVMDGRFVPNITIGPDHINEIDMDFLLEAHLMVRRPEDYIDRFEKNTYMIIPHIESLIHVGDSIDQIKSDGFKVGIALNPPTPASEIVDYISKIDQVLVMTVHPGFSGQGFIPEMLPKIREIRKLSQTIDIAVDGGINAHTAYDCGKAGANSFAAASSIFAAPDIRQAVSDILEAGKKGWAARNRHGR